MIKVRDYQSFGSFVSPPGRDTLLTELRSLIGRPVTIFTDSGGRSGCDFTGVLTEVYSDSVRLLTALPSAPLNPACGRPCRRRSTPGSSTLILLEHITAVTKNFV